MSTIAVIKNIKVSEAQGFDCSVFGGGPKLLAAHGLLERLCLKAPGLNPQRTNQLVRFAYVHHDRKLRGVWVKNRTKWQRGEFSPMQKRGAWLRDYSDYSRGAPSMETVGSLSLVPELRIGLEVSLIAQFESPVNLGHFNNVLAQARFAGAALYRQPEISLFENIEDALESLRTGFLFVRRDDLMTAHQSKLDSFVYALGSNTESFVSPAVYGHALLETPVNRPGALNGLEHAMAEPVIGLGQYKSVASFVAEPESAFFKPTWTHPEVFELVQTQQEDPSQPDLQDIELEFDQYTF